MKVLRNLLVLSIIPILLIAMASVTPAYAGAPVVYNFPVDDTNPLKNPCGFEIADHVYGTLRMEWRYDQAGQETRVDAFWGEMKETWSANGKSLKVQINGGGHVQFGPGATEYIAKWTGPASFITVPGYGHVYGSAGSITTRWSWPENEFIEVIKVVGNPFIENWDPICAYLAP